MFDSGAETDKRWGMISTWEELLRAWDEGRSETAAIGLLYAGATIFTLDGEVGWESRSLCFNDKVDFYLEVDARSPNPKVALVARQILARHLLRESLELSWKGMIGASHLALLDFLGTIPAGLSEPPHPRFVERFLFHAFDKWVAVMTNSAETAKDYAGYAMLGESFGPLATDRLLRAASAWGLLGKLIASQTKPLSPDLLRLVHEKGASFLLLVMGPTEERRKACRRRALLSALRTSRDVNDLGDEDGENHLRQQAALTLLCLEEAVRK